MTETVIPTDWPYGEHSTVFGTTGSGKTFMVKNQILPQRKRFIVVDSETDAKGNSYDFSEKCFIDTSPEKAAKIAAGDKNFRLRVYLPTGDEGKAQMEDFCHDILYKGTHHTLIYFDEVTDFSDAYTVGDNMSALVRKSRKRDITVIVGSQLPKGLNNWFVSNSRHVFVFGMIPEDAERWVHVKWIQDVMPQIPIGSFKFAYRNPIGQVFIMEPVEEYPWSKVK